MRDPPSLVQRFDAMRAAPPTSIVGERQIEAIYDITTARFCTIVASTLEHHLPLWSTGLLALSLDGKAKRGIADGFLKFQKSPQVLCPLQTDFAEVVQSFPVIGTWEFKNMIAGSLEVFSAIVQYSGGQEFPWEGCELKSRCPILHTGKDGGPAITGSKKHARHIIQQVDMIQSDPCHRSSQSSIGVD
jgi:hypothetical protein